MPSDAACRSTGFAYSTDQTSSERAIKTNKEYIEFVNICVTNFGKDQAEKFFEVYQLHFNADVAFLQSDYPRSYRNVYSSHKAHAEVVNEILTKYYLEQSKDILDRLAPGVIKSKNPSARLYLTLAYRDRSVARNLQQLGDAAQPRFFSAKIEKYIEAIKIARRCLRYGFLALYESQNIDTKKMIYDRMFTTEKEAGNLFYGRFLGKDDAATVAEINRTVDDFEAAQPAADAQNPPAEKKLERRARFKHEREVARSLREGDFKGAEEIIRQYVDDFNYKLIVATFDTLSKENRPELTGLDVANLKAHHADNYSRMVNESVLESFMARVKVIDDLGRPGNNAGNRPPAANSAQPAEGQPAPGGAAGQR